MADKTGSSNRSLSKAHNRSSWPNESKVFITVINSTVKTTKSFRPQHTQTNLAKCPPINATSTDNRKLQCDHPNRKYLYLRQYDIHHYNSDGKPSIRASSQKVSTGYHQRQPEIATWLPKPEIVISLELQLIASKFQRQVGYFWPLRIRIMYPELLWQCPTTGNGIMAYKTGNTYIAWTTTGMTTIPTANLGFSAMPSSKKLTPSDCNNDRQPTIATWLPKPEIVISLELELIASKFQRQAV